MAVSPTGPQRIPAWKRIGLQLTLAKNETGNATPDRTQEHHTDDFPLASPIGQALFSTNARHSKRRKISPELHHDSQPPVTVDADRPTPRNVQHQRDDTEVPIAPKVLLRAVTYRRKSVTFTAETKQEDGRERLDSPPQTKSKSTVQPIDTSRHRSEHAISKAIDRSSSATPTVRGGTKYPSDQATPAFVKYLDQFHNDRASWKFNKKKQNDLIKNLYDIDLLPPEHNEAIVLYMLGLQGVRATARVEKSSRAVLEGIIKKFDGEESLVDPSIDSRESADMEFAEARLNAYHQALQRSLDRFVYAGAHRSEYDDHKFEEMRQEIEQGQRAERILTELWTKDSLRNDALDPRTRVEVKTAADSGDPDPITGKALPTPSLASEGSAPLQKEQASSRRKRKLRTQGVGQTESEGGSERPRKRGPNTVLEALSSGKKAEFKGKIDPNLARGTAAKKIFDDDLLDQLFPSSKSYHDRAPKRKAGVASKPRGFAYTHGTPADESGSEEDE